MRSKEERKTNPARQVRKKKKRNRNKNKVRASKTKFKSPSANRQTFTDGETFLNWLRFYNAALCRLWYQREQRQLSGCKLTLQTGCDRSGWKGWVRGRLKRFPAPQAFDAWEHAKVRQLRWWERKDVGYREKKRNSHGEERRGTTPNRVSYRNLVQVHVRL